MDILEVIRKIVDEGLDIGDLEKTKREIEEIDREINGLKEKIRELEQQKTEIMASVPEEIRSLIFGNRRATARAAKNGRYFVERDGHKYTLREAFYTEFPEKQGKSYKTEYMLKKLEDLGYKLVE